MVIVIAIMLTYKRSMKSVPTRSYSGPHFPAFELNTEKNGLVGMWENADQNNSEYGHLLRSEKVL